MSDSEHSGASKKIVIRKVDMDAPWRWLIAGWHDFLAAPLFSLVYGCVFALVGDGLTWGLLEESLFHLPSACTMPVIVLNRASRYPSAIAGWRAGEILARSP